MSSIFRNPRLAAYALLLLALMSYLPALNAGFVFDDSLYVTEDNRLGTVSGLGRIWTEVGGPAYKHQYYPLTSSAFWLQHWLWGQHPAGYHLINVLLHAVNALLLWRLLRAVGLPGAYLAGVIFAVHPVHVQSVAWISELKNVLSTLFMLLSMGQLVRWLGLAENRAESRDSLQFRREASASSERLRSKLEAVPIFPILRYAAGLVLFIAALLSKTATSLLPAALLLVVWWKRGRVSRRDVAGLVPLAAIGATFVLLTVYLESRFGGAHGDGFGQSAVERVLIAGRALWFYAGKLVWPAELVFIYPRWVIDAGVWWPYAYPLGAAIVLAALWMLRKRLGRGPIAAVAFFIVALAPVSFVNVAFMRHSFVSDHWQYWASMGMIALLVGAAASHWRRWRARPAIEWGGVTLSVSVVGALSAGTWLRCLDYETPERLWSDTLAKNPGSWAAHNNLGNALKNEGRLDEAIEHYRAAIRLNAEFVVAHNNLGAAFQARGEPEQAIGHYFEALRIAPGYALAHYNVGVAYQALGDDETAIKAYRETIHIDPHRADAHNHLGIILLSRGDAGEALEHFREVLGVAPTYPGAHYNLGLALQREGRLEEAGHRFRLALRLQPDSVEAHTNLGTVLLGMGRLDEAIGCFGNALGIDDRHPGAHYNLGIALARQGRWEEAMGCYTAVLAIDPDYAEAHNNLAVVLQSRGRIDEAIEHYEAAIRIDPGYALAHYNLGVILQHVGDLGEAIAHYEEAVIQQPDLARAHHRLGAALGRAGRAARGLAHLREATELAPDWAAPLKETAWLLATHSDESIRDADSAVRLAEHAAELTGYADAAVLDVLAAASSEAGQFKRAVRTAEQALAMAMESGDEELAAGIGHRLELYRESQPYRDMGWPPEDAGAPPGVVESAAGAE